MKITSQKSQQLKRGENVRAKRKKRKNKTEDQFMTSSPNMQLKEFPERENEKGEVGGNHHLINQTKYPRVEVDHNTLDSKVKTVTE